MIQQWLLYSNALQFVGKFKKKSISENNVVVGKIACCKNAHADWPNSATVPKQKLEYEDR